MMKTACGTLAEPWTNLSARFVFSACGFNHLHHLEPWNLVFTILFVIVIIISSTYNIGNTYTRIVYRGSVGSVFKVPRFQIELNS